MQRADRVSISSGFARRSRSLTLVWTGWPLWHFHSGSRRDLYCSKSRFSEPSNIGSEVSSYLALQSDA